MHRSRPRSVQAVRDAAVLAEIERIYHDPTLGRGVYEARNVWHQAAPRQGGVNQRPVPRCQVEQLMSGAGLQDAVRGRTVVTTKPVARPPSLLRSRRSGKGAVHCGLFSGRGSETGASLEQRDQQVELVWVSRPMRQGRRM